MIAELPQVAFVYHREDLSDEEMVERANSLGAAGWEWFAVGQPHVETRRVSAPGGAGETDQVSMVTPCFFRRAFLTEAEPSEPDQP